MVFCNCVLFKLVVDCVPCGICCWISVNPVSIIFAVVFTSCFVPVAVTSTI